MNVLITGASRGIGAALAPELAREGHRLFLVSRSADKTAKLAAECNRQAKKDVATSVPFDLTTLREQEHALTDMIVRHTEVIDVLVNNAGLVLRKPFAEITTEESRRVFEVNYFAPETLIRSFLPLLRRSEAPSVINVTSMGGVQGSNKFKGLSAYSASKGALTILTECLAEEFGSDNIHVNALALGAVQTEMLAEAFPGFDAPVGADEMGSFMKWFITTGGRYFNGKTLPVSVSTP